MKHKPEKHKAKTHNGMTKGKRTDFEWNPEKYIKQMQRAAARYVRFAEKTSKKKGNSENKEHPRWKKWGNRENAYILSASQFVWDMIQNPKTPQKSCWERAATRLPSVIRVQEHHQAPISEALRLLHIQRNNLNKKKKKKTQIPKATLPPKQLRKENVLCVRQREKRNYSSCFDFTFRKWNMLVI